MKKKEEADEVLRGHYVYAQYQYLSLTSLIARLEDELGIPWIESKLPNRKRSAKEKDRLRQEK